MYGSVSVMSIYHIYFLFNRKLFKISADRKTKDILWRYPHGTSFVAGFRSQPFVPLSRKIR